MSAAWLSQSAAELVAPSLIPSAGEVVYISLITSFPTFGDHAPQEEWHRQDKDRRLAKAYRLHSRVPMPSPAKLDNDVRTLLHAREHLACADTTDLHASVGFCCYSVQASRYSSSLLNLVVMKHLCTLHKRDTLKCIRVSCLQREGPKR